MDGSSNSKLLSDTALLSNIGRAIYNNNFLFYFTISVIIYLR
jgi:hypothetical protein